MAEGGIVNRNLLEQAEQSGDVVIVTENGAEVRCHKAVLIGKSNVFKSLLKIGTTEAKTSRLEMPDMSEAGVQALLAYLYCNDLKNTLAQGRTQKISLGWSQLNTKNTLCMYDSQNSMYIEYNTGIGRTTPRYANALACSRTAVELLIAGYKYEILGLFDSMKELILQKRNEWFSVFAAVKLLVLTRNKPDQHALKEIEKKTASVIISKPLGELKQYPQFAGLFDTPDNGIQMFAYLMRNACNTDVQQ